MLSLHRYRWLGNTGLLLAPTFLLVLLLVARVIPLPIPLKPLIFNNDLPNAFRQPLQLSSDPYTNADSQHHTEVEPGMYAYGSTIVTAFQVGRYADAGTSNNGWATSSDSGHSWKTGFLPGTTQFNGGPYTRLSDPSVAYDAAHNTWIIASLAIVGDGATLASPTIIVNLSTDGGLTWSKPYKVVDGGSTFYDKEWVVCDSNGTSPFYGHCYIQWDNDDKGGLILMSTSTDGGRTWSKPRTTADQAHGTGGQPLVQPNGTVIVPISGYGNMQLLSFISTNGGQSWSKTILIARINGNIFSTAGIDGAGKVYLVWIDCRFEKNCNAIGAGQDDLVMSTSTDGIHWSQPRLIPVDALGSGIDHLIPGLGADSATSGNTAHLALTFYYHQVNCDTNCPYSVGFVSSSDGGAHWTPKLQLAGPMDLSWLPAGRNKVGDYISTSFCNGLAFPAFSIAGASNGGQLNEAIYTITNGLEV